MDHENISNLIMDFLHNLHYINMIVSTISKPQKCILSEKGLDNWTHVKMNGER